MCPWAFQLSHFLFLCVYEKEGNVLGILTQKHAGHHQPLGYYSQQLDLYMGIPLALRVITVAALLVKATEKIIVGSLSTTFVPQAEAFLNSYHTQHFSVRYLTSYEFLLLTVPH